MRRFYAFAMLLTDADDHPMRDKMKPRFQKRENPTISIEPNNERGQGDENYTITLIVGTNGSVTSVTRKVAEEDVPVEPDEVNGNTIPFPSAVQLMILGRLLSQYQL
jgi:hypothetical protein